MSLEQLRAVRRGNRRPAGTVRVVIGRAPRWFDEGPQDVVIDRALTDIDLRPLFGLHVELFDLQANSDLTLRVVAELQALETTLVGAAGHYGEVGVNEEHELALRRYLENLCRI